MFKQLSLEWKPSDSLWWVTVEEGYLSDGVFKMTDGRAKWFHHYQEALDHLITIAKNRS